MPGPRKNVCSVECREHSVIWIPFIASPGPSSSKQIPLLCREFICKGTLCLFDIFPGDCTDKEVEKGSHQELSCTVIIHTSHIHPGGHIHYVLQQLLSTFSLPAQNPVLIFSIVSSSLFKCIFEYQAEEHVY